MRSSRKLVAIILLMGFGAGVLYALVQTELATAPPSGKESAQADSADAGRSDALIPAPTGGEPAHPGQALYELHCASCHGLRGEGQPDWKISREDGSLPAPPHDSSGHTWHHSDADLLQIISEGGVIYMPESQMPGYAAQLDETEMRAVLAYIKTMWGPSELGYQEELSADWENASGAGEQP